MGIIVRVNQFAITSASKIVFISIIDAFLIGHVRAHTFLSIVQRISHFCESSKSMRSIEIYATNL